MSAFPEGFHPEIDRYDQRSARRLFAWLWSDPAVSEACVRNLATSIRIAQEAGDASWGVTMHENALRLNVGQVETLTLAAEGARFLFLSPLDVGSYPQIEIAFRGDAFYRAVPVASGVCFVPSTDMSSFPPAIREAHNSYIRVAAAYKRVSPFKASFSPAVLEYLESLLNEVLPRPAYFVRLGAAERVDPLAEEVDAFPGIREGARYQITVNAYERNPRARQLCIAAHGTDCFICGFSFGKTYGEVAQGVIHVHHLRPLSEIGEEYEVDAIQDLRPVCPNCHAVLHRRIPAYSIEEVQAFLKQPCA